MNAISRLIEKELLVHISIKKEKEEAESTTTTWEKNLFIDLLETFTKIHKSLK